MRIIAGAAGGTFLAIPKGPAIRPTPDKVKQAIFSSLGERIIGARVLDLYSGTGALGLEAVSRGATEALLVDESRFCVEAAAANARKARLEEKVFVQRGDAIRSVEQFSREGQRFDIIFADPPYEKKGTRESGRILDLPPVGTTTPLTRPLLQGERRTETQGRANFLAPPGERTKVRGSVRGQRQDMPREGSVTKMLLNCAALVSILAPNGVLVMEHFKADSPEPSSHWQPGRQLRHGDTLVSFFQVRS
jgi:16S rRNA (guanine(966)-N(2))-methyltransferase RsmD